MPAKTTEKREIGEVMVIADLMRQGHDVAIPFGHNQPFDLIIHPHRRRAVGEGFAGRRIS